MSLIAILQGNRWHEIHVYITETLKYKCVYAGAAERWTYVMLHLVSTGYDRVDIRYVTLSVHGMGPGGHAVRYT